MKTRISCMKFNRVTLTVMTTFGKPFGWWMRKEFLLRRMLDLIDTKPKSNQNLKTVFWLSCPNMLSKCLEHPVSYFSYFLTDYVWSWCLACLDVTNLCLQVGEENMMKFWLAKYTKIRAILLCTLVLRKMELENVIRWDHMWCLLKWAWRFCTDRWYSEYYSSYRKRKFRQREMDNVKITVLNVALALMVNWFCNRQSSFQIK